jgi:phage FluMu protein Com
MWPGGDASRTLGPVDASTCPRHPDVETRLRCSACDTLICPSCANEAAVGYKCPDCKAIERGDDAASTRRAGSSPFDRLGAGFRGLGNGRGSGGRSGDGTSKRRATPSIGAGSSGRGDAPTPMAINVRATIVGAGAAVAGGFLMAPILVGGMLFLISAGVIGWLVARAVYWASEERNSPYLRTAALSLSGLTVAIGIAQASGMTNVSEIAYLAFPAAVYGGWIVVRQR